MNRLFPNLYTPIKIGTVTLKNRIIASPSSQGDVMNDGTLGNHNIAYYARKAKGGVSMVVVGDGIVHPSGQNHPKQVYLYTDNCIPGLVRCAEEIHKYNCIASYELSHGGIVCDPAFIGGQMPYGPSVVPVTIGFQTNNPLEIFSQEMTEEMMYEIAEAYGKAAARVKRAGFDMVMIHAAHGWLIGQFFSPYLNKRTDKYGGSVENRCRFAILVLEMVRKAVGPGFPIDLRINGRDGNDGGLELPESIEICKILEPYVDSFHVSSCLHCIPSHQDIMQSTIFQPHGHLLHLAAAVKKEVKKPVATVGGFSDLFKMEEALVNGQADIIALGRQMLADPDIANKGRAGCPEEVRRCLRCATCQSARFTLGTARCAVNPEIGREYELQFASQPKEKKKVLVAGAGPAGMQAAITAAEQGHDVTLYEKSDSLGGALNFAQYVPFKEDLYQLVKYMETRLSKLPVKIVLNTELTRELALQNKADAIIAATGAQALRLNIPGADSGWVLMADEVDKGAAVGQNIAVIGGGLVGVETAINLAMQGKNVTILEMMDKIANDANIRYARTYPLELGKWNVAVRTGVKCTSIQKDGVSGLDANGKEIFVPADTVVVSIGMRPLYEKVEELRDCAPVFIATGNSVKAGQVQNAVRSGYDAAMNMNC